MGVSYIVRASTQYIKINGNDCQSTKIDSESLNTFPLYGKFDLCNNNSNNYTTFLFTGTDGRRFHFSL